MAYYFKLNKMYSIARSIRLNHTDRDEFSFKIKDVNFQVVILLTHTPFELLVGARGHKWACVLKVENKFLTSMPDDKYYELRELLGLKGLSGPEFTSFTFLKILNDNFPAKYSGIPVQPSHITRFYPVDPEKDGKIKDVFWGWNDHVRDGNTARNFDKTEKYLNAQVADFCRANNISSVWRCSADGYKEKPVHYPDGYLKK